MRTATHTHRHTSTRSNSHTATQTHRHTGTQTHRHTDTQTHRHTDTDTDKLLTPMLADEPENLFMFAANSQEALCFSVACREAMPLFGMACSCRSGLTGGTHVNFLWANSSINLDQLLTPPVADGLYTFNLDQLLTPPLADGLYTSERLVGQFLYQFGPVAHSTFG